MGGCASPISTNSRGDTGRSFFSNVQYPSAQTQWATPFSQVNILFVLNLHLQPALVKVGWREGGSGWAEGRINKWTDGWRETIDQRLEAGSKVCTILYRCCNSIAIFLYPVPYAKVPKKQTLIHTHARPQWEIEQGATFVIRHKWPPLLDSSGFVVSAVRWINKAQVTDRPALRDIISVKYESHNRQGSHQVWLAYCRASCTSVTLDTEALFPRSCS